MNFGKLMRGSIFVLLLFVSSCGFFGWKIGDRVLAQWTGDNYWYPGTITKVEGGQYYVVFMDGDEEWLKSDRLAKEDLKVGDAIECNWLYQGYYYDCTITSRNGDELTVKYVKDGDTEQTSIAAARVKRE